MKGILRILVKWLQPKHKTEYQEELPDLLNNKTIYIVGQPEQPWMVAFKCPCGCGNVIHLNLLQDSNPRWRIIKNSKGRITISPSVWRTRGCKSHFFVRKSKIDWI